MIPAIATVVYAIGIVGLFILDRDSNSHTSKALWIPVAWLLLAGSRPVSLWFQGAAVAESADTYNVEANPINVVIFTVLLAAGLIVLFNRAQQVGTILQANWPILLFFLYCAFSTVWSDYPVAAFRHWIRSVGDPVMVLIVLTDLEPVAALKRLVTRAGFLLIPLSVLLIKYYPALGRTYTNSWELMYIGVAGHKTELGMICLTLGLGFLWIFRERYRNKDAAHRRRHLIAIATVLGMVLWLLWMAQSMTSLSCFVIAGGLMVVATRPLLARKPAVVHVLVSAIICLCLFALFLDPGASLVESLGKDATLTGRTKIWHQVLSLAGNQWFGTGFESFWLGDRIREIWSNNVGDQLNEAHNGYLEVYLNLGWIGVTLLAALIVTGYRNVIVAFRQDRYLGGLKLAYFVAGVIYSLTEAGFRMTAPTWIFFLLATTAVPQPYIVNAPNLNEEVTPPDYWVRDYEGVV